ncbi:MAG TPA: PLP-dependent aminotransferase family protein [Dehalococcoidia bacterium]|nr:PLP-dependent aminotransferase family protein [Dehalococcoidia bacterium]
MAGTDRFSFEKLFAKNAPVGAKTSFRRPKYDFAVAYPDPDTLPLEGLANAMRTALERDGKELSYYPDYVGLLSLRELIADKLVRDRNMKITAEDVVITSGSGEAISMIIQSLTDPGDVVITEEFLYLGTLRQMRRYSADVVGVKCDDDGMIPEELEATLNRLKGEGKRVKYLYTIPTFQNPLGWTMTLKRRKSMLEIAGSHGIPIFEDDCYVDLRFGGEDVTSIHSLDDSGQVIYVGSFSKIIAPGARMGYMVAPEELTLRAMSFKGGGGTNQLAAMAIEEYLKHEMYQHIDEQNRSLIVKRDAMLASLGENFGDTAKWAIPQGGLCVWLEFPEGTDLAAVQEQSFAEGVGYYNGTQFSPEGRGANFARLCYGHPSPEMVYEGVSELARALERHGVIKP